MPYLFGRTAELELGRPLGDAETLEFFLADFFAALGLLAMRHAIVYTHGSFWQAESSLRPGRRPKSAENRPKLTNHPHRTSASN
jgi:hypothetical protein